jgi:hypothetical protein
MHQPILVLSPRVTPDSNQMIEAARRGGQVAVRLPTFRPTSDLISKRITVYGEPLFALILSNALQHALIEPGDHWLTTLPMVYRQREIVHSTLGEARSLSQPRFVKNADGMKAFDARVYASGDELPPADFYPDDYKVLVAEPVTWAVEYRCFVLERRVATLSIYLRDGIIAHDADGVWFNETPQVSEAQAFCQTVLDDADVAVPPACTIDVGVISGRGWAVVEANPAYGSGIYGCAPDAVLSVVNRACIPNDALTQADQPWVHPYDVSD